MTANRIPVLVTGGKGMLGSALAEEASRYPGLAVTAPGREALDVRDLRAFDAFKDAAAGGWLIHCAARVDVEGCAREPEAARETIVQGTANAVAFAKAVGARVLYPQSFLVYDAAANPIPEDETPRPLHLYGELKYEAERTVLAAVPDAIIVRMAGFFGGEAKDKNFVGKIIPVMHAAMSRGETTFEVGTRVWQPTWTNDLAANTLLLLMQGGSGTYQMGCRGEASFADIAEVIVRALGWSERFGIVHVDPAAVSANELGRRPDRAVLSGARLRAEGLDLQRDWSASLRAYLTHPFFDQYRLEPAR